MIEREAVAKSLVDVLKKIEGRQREEVARGVGTKHAVIKASDVEAQDERRPEQSVDQFIDPVLCVGFELTCFTVEDHSQAQAHQVGVVPSPDLLCRALGFDGFQSFKVQLAQQLGFGSVYTQFAVDDSDTATDLRDKVFDTTVGSLLTVRNELDPAALERAIDTIRKARRVEFYGFGASGSVAAVASLPPARLLMRKWQNALKGTGRNAVWKSGRRSRSRSI